MTILRCGHSDGYAYKTQGYYRCSRCQTDKRRERRARARLLAGLGEVKSDPDRNGGSYAHLADADPIFGDDSHVASTRAGSQSLLTALYRQHPYVFEAAERAGRLAVRP